MSWLIHNGRFYTAQPTKLRLVAAVWDREEGGGIITYIDLGEHTTETSCMKAVEEKGLTVRGNLCPGGLTLTWGSETVRPDIMINTYSKEGAYVPAGSKLAYKDESDG